jgi:hypothetical protein
MGWAKLDDGFYDHPKVRQAGPIAAFLFVQSLCYCARYGTDGMVPWTVVVGWEREADLETHPTGGKGGGVSYRCEAIQRLLDVELWRFVDSEGGEEPWIEVHDYLQYNLSREEWAEKQERLKARASAGGRARAEQLKAQLEAQPQGRQQAQPPTRPDPTPVPTVQVETVFPAKGTKIPPTLAEVEDFIREKGLGDHVNAKKFHAHYTGNGWMRGKAKMKNWKAVVWTWYYDRAGVEA